MIKTVYLIVLSFFAVIGFLDTVATLIDTVAVSKYDCIEDVTLRVKLRGRIHNVCFLLNTFLLAARRINYKNTVTAVTVDATDTDADTYTQIKEFCLENDDITVEK